MLLGPEDLPKYKKICKSLDKGKSTHTHLASFCVSLAHAWQQTTSAFVSVCFFPLWLSCGCERPLRALYAL